MQNRAPNSPSGPGGRGGGEGEAQSRAAWLWPGIAAISAVAGVIGIWFLALPRHEICAAIYPAPPGCSVSRTPAAVFWTCVLLVTASVTYMAMRMREPRWLAPVCAIGTAALALIGYWSVLYQ